ncbi:MAG: fused MFS/spermidine synthase [Pirellulales bacterium]|nr:fused MFS/spermidine synthase [Pirellulales bacterium]
MEEKTATSEKSEVRALTGGLFGVSSAVAIFTGALLLFLVQPIMSKMILPWFGGAPNVWTTCMLFFQTVLVLGYLYAHILATRLSPKSQFGLHCLLLFVSVLSLPILVNESWKPEGGEDPVLQILMLLSATVGLPYFLLSSTGPLVQSWFAARLPGQSPYRLYALSNVGSMLALISFPFLVEVLLDSNGQSWMWTLIYVFYSVVILFVGWQYKNVNGNTLSDHKAESEGQSISRMHVTGWFLFPAMASVMFLAITNYLCQDVAVIPFLWISPLAIYLLSFILCFDHPRWYNRRFFASLSVLGITYISLLYYRDIADIFLFNPIGLENLLTDLYDNMLLRFVVALGVLFSICMMCHGELTRCKPEAGRLTQFYLSISVGGALGGLFVSVVCPLVFTGYVEYHLGLVAAFLIAAVILIKEVIGKGSLKQACITLLVGLAAGLNVGAQWDILQVDRIAASRNFYGTLRVVQKDELGVMPAQRRLVHGRIIHGVQLADTGQHGTPTSYYNAESGVATTLKLMHEREAIHVGVVGLGVGTLVTYGREDDQYTFFEINPAVVDYANEHFTFLSKTKAQVNTIVADGRLGLESLDEEVLDLLVIDAFSSDSIPAHLLTVEAMEIYQRVVKDDGLIALHLSNNHLNLLPVVVNAADHLRLAVRAFKTPGNPEVAADNALWVIVGEDQNVMQQLRTMGGGGYTPSVQDAKHVPLWTDKYSSLWHVLGE